MSIASEIALQIEELEDQNADLHAQLEDKDKEIQAFEHSLEELDADYDNFMAYAESVTPGVVLAYKAQKELTK